MTWRKRIRWLVLLPALLVVGLPTLFAGFSSPLWHIEHLDRPQAVRSTIDGELVLADGRSIVVPHIRTLPRENPLFQAALSQGVEVGPHGEIHGLLWCDRSCGLDPVLWRRLRVNLSDLAGALHPAGIDDSLVPHETVELLRRHPRIDLSSPSRSHRNLHLTIEDLYSLRYIHEEFASSVRRSDITEDFEITRRSAIRGR
jgi:hypothetical protein